MPPRLPTPPPQYDMQDQAALRREIELSIAKVESAATGAPGSVAAPIDGQFVTHTNDIRLTNQRLLTNTSEVSFDTSVVGQVKAVIAAAIARIATSQTWTALQIFSAGIRAAVFNDDGAGNATKFTSAAAGVGPIVRLERTAATARVWQLRLGTNGRLQFVDETGGVLLAEIDTTGTVRVGTGANAPSNVGVVTIAGGGIIGLVSRTSNWQVICEHDTADKQFRIDNTTGSVNFHHGAAASVAANNFMSALNKDVTLHGAVTLDGGNLTVAAGNTHAGRSATNETANPMLMVHGGTGAAGSGRTGSLQVDAANRHLNIGAWNGIQLYANVGDEAAPTTGVLGLSVGGTGIVTVPTNQLNLTGSHGLKFDTKDAGMFADASFVYVTDYSTGLKGLRVNYSSGVVLNKDGNLIPGLIISGSGPSGTAMNGTLWCKV